jgi:ABC-type transport system substrate-binding protein
LVYRSLPNNQKRWQSLRQGQLDALQWAGAPEDIERQFPEQLRRLAYENTLGDAILINHDRAPFEDRRVRKALAALIDRQTASGNASAFATPIEYPVGLPNGLTGEYLDRLDRFQQYGYGDSRREQATRLLEKAGYTRQ